MNNYAYIPLPEPVPITEQVWSEGTLPLVHTRTMTYMHENYIRDCIEGILSQKTTFPVQVLIHDDASSDKTVEIVKEYEQKYPRLIKAYYQKENTYARKNRSKLRAEFFSWRTGKYEAICEGDDYWTDANKLQRQVSLLEENDNISLSAENGLVKNAMSNSEYLFNNEINEKYYTTYELLEYRKFPTASVVYPFHYIKNNHEFKISLDTVLWVFLSTKGKVHYNPVVSSVYNRTKFGMVEGTDKIKWATKLKKCNNDMILIIRNSYLDNGFNYNIFKERNFSEFFKAFNYYKILKKPLKKILCLIECFTIFPIKTFIKVARIFRSKFKRILLQIFFGG